MREQSEQAQIRRQTFCAASNHSLVFCHNLCASAINNILAFGTIFKTIYEYKQMDDADLEKQHCLLLIKVFFPSLCHIL